MRRLQTEIPLPSPKTSIRHKILDGAVTIYNRPETALWWASFFHHRKEIRTSTKTADLEEAKLFAKTWYFNKQVQISSGVVPGTKADSFRYAAEQALTQYRTDADNGKRSHSYVDGIERTLKNLVPMIGDLDIKTINQGVWNRTKNTIMQRGNLSKNTLHQWKNAMRIVLKQSAMRGELHTLPVFMTDIAVNTQDTPRIWFNSEQYAELILAIRRNIAYHRQNKTAHLESSEELRDYVIIVANTGLRIGEAMNVRFCDVTIKEEPFTKKQYLEVRNIKGKRGNAGVCKSYYGAVKSFERCVKRHALKLDNYKDSTAGIFKEYHRAMFKQILKKINLYETADRPPRRRDLMVLRHTYICFRLMQGVGVFDIANNCRTSVQMIENHYARHLNILDSDTINANKFPRSR